MSSEETDYAGILSRLIEFQGKRLVVSLAGAEESQPVFAFFDAQLIRGFDHNMGDDLGHDPESIELVFDNGVTLVIDPTQIGRAVWTVHERGGMLQFELGGVHFLLTQDDDLDD